MVNCFAVTLKFNDVFLIALIFLHRKYGTFDFILTQIFILFDPVSIFILLYTFIFKL